MNDEDITTLKETLTEIYDELIRLKLQFQLIANAFQRHLEEFHADES